MDTIHDHVLRMVACSWPHHNNLLGYLKRHACDAANPVFVAGLQQKENDFTAVFIFESHDGLGPNDLMRESLNYFYHHTMSEAWVDATQHRKGGFNYFTQKKGGTVLWNIYPIP